MESTGHIRLEALVAKYLTSKCEFDTFPQQLRQTQFKVSVFEFLPEVWVSDDQYYMEAVFTREAYNDFKKLHAGQKLLKLKDKMILVKRWGLVAKEVDSDEVYTSFMNVKVQLVIEQFQPLVHENLSSVQTRKFENLFEESKEVREIIKSIKHNHYKTNLKKVPKAQALNLNATKVQNTYDLSYDSVFKSNFTEPTHDTDSDDQKGLKAYLEKDLKTYKIVEIFQLLSNEVKPESLMEVKEKCQVWSFDNIQKAKEREATKQALDFVQINRAIPENKDAQARKKKKDARAKKNAADLEMVQIEKVAKKQALTEDDIFEGRKAPLPKKEQAKAQKPPTPQKHKGYDFSVLKDKLLKILNPKLGNRPSFTEDQQRKTFSTEDLIQSRVVPFLNLGNRELRQEAMSQFITYNRLDDEEEQTETEKDEDEEMLEQRRLGVLNNFKMNIYMFQKFVKWQRLHQVSKHPILDYTNAKKEEELEFQKEQQMAKEEAEIQKDFEQEEEDEVMDQVEKIQSDEEEEDNQPVRRSSRPKKQILHNQPEEMDIEEPEEYNSEPEEEEKSEKQVPQKKGFQTLLDDDVDDDSSKQLDEEYESPYEEGDPGEKVELENLNDLIKREKLEISQLVQTKPNTKKMLESSDEEISSVKNHSLQKMSPQKEFHSAAKKPQLLEITEKKVKANAEMLESPQAFKKQSPQKQSPQKFSPQKYSPKKFSPQKYEEDSEEEEDIIINKKGQNMKKQRKPFEDDTSEEEVEFVPKKSPQKEYKHLETPKNTTSNAMYEEAQEERGTTATNNIKSSSQQSSQEEDELVQKQIQKKKFEELLNSSQNQRKVPSPIAMKKSSAIKVPSDFASVSFGMSEKSIINLGEKRAGYEIDSKQANRLKFEDSDDEEEEDEKVGYHVEKLPLQTHLLSRKSSFEDDLDVIVPENNDGEMSPTYSIAPDPEVRELAPEMKEKFVVKAPFFQGQTEKHLEDSGQKPIPTFGGQSTSGAGAGTPEWHRSCENSERMSDKSGATLNQQMIAEKMRKLEEENQKLRSQMMRAQTEDYNRRQERIRNKERDDRREKKQRKREEKEERKRQQLLEDKQQIKSQIRGLLSSDKKRRE